MIANNVIKK